MEKETLEGLICSYGHLSPDPEIQEKARALRAADLEKALADREKYCAMWAQYFEKEREKYLSDGWQIDSIDNLQAALAAGLEVKGSAISVYIYTRPEGYLYEAKDGAIHHVIFSPAIFPVYVHEYPAPTSLAEAREILNKISEVPVDATADGLERVHSNEIHTLDMTAREIEDLYICENDMQSAAIGRVLTYRAYNKRIVNQVNGSGPGALIVKAMLEMGYKYKEGA